MFLLQRLMAVLSQVGKVSITKPADGASKSFTFDAAYNMDSNSQAIYEEMAFPLVEGVSFLSPTTLLGIAA